MGEFELIDRYFLRRGRPASDRVPLGVGDVLRLLAPSPPPAGRLQRHAAGGPSFPDDSVDPESLGHKALAVNLSDLAACGARPLAFTLALALPSADAQWLEAFSRGLFALADAHGCELVGGDTTRGPLTICITVFGEVPPGEALLRSGARAGDDIWVSGTLGDARLALEVFRGALALPPALFEAVRERMERPVPRVALGQALRGIASAAIDVSDGLLGDLGHLLRRSGAGATLDTGVARHLLAARRLGDGGGLPDSATQLEYVLAGGDDYELAFTAPPRPARGRRKPPPRPAPRRSLASGGSMPIRACA